MAGATTLSRPRPRWVAGPAGFPVLLGRLRPSVNPTLQLWTAQGEVASLIAAVRPAIPQRWQIGAVDVLGAFMYAPLPENMLVVVQPPWFFIDMGLAKPGELWTLCRAEYGLKVSPRAWGLIIS